MAYNTKPIITDVNGNPAPCVFDDSTTADKYTYMRGKDGVGAYYIPVDESGNQLFSPTNPGKVSIGDSVLPTGGATEAKQNDIITALTAQLDITLSALRDAIAGSGLDAKTLGDLWNKLETIASLLNGTLTTNVTSSVLPTGASTSVKQDLAKAVLDNIKTAADAIQAAVESTLAVEVTGSNMELWGADVGSRPAYDAVSVGTIFIAINGGAHEAWQSDGTKWVEV